MLVARQWTAPFLAFFALSVTLCANPQPPAPISILEDQTTSKGASAQKIGNAWTFKVEGKGEGKLESTQEFKTPLIISARVKTDSTNIRLYYGPGTVILNWEANPKELRVHDPKTGAQKAFPNVGQIPTDKWINVTWIIDEGTAKIDASWGDGGNWQDLTDHCQALVAGDSLTVPISPEAFKLAAIWQANFRITFFDGNELKSLSSSCSRGEQSFLYKIPLLLTPEEKAQVQKIPASNPVTPLPVQPLAPGVQRG